MIISLIIIIVFLLIVIYYLYIQNVALRNKATQELTVKEAVEELRVEQDLLVGKEINEEKIDHKPFESTDSVLENTKVIKKEAINIVNETLGRNELSNANTNFSNLNKAKPVWWFDINQKRFLKDLHLILAKNKGFIWIKIPKGAIKDVSKTFYIRGDNGLVDIVISSETGINYLRDDKGDASFNFEQYIEMEFH